MTNANLPAEPSGIFALRTPLLPWDEVERWGENLRAPAALSSPAALTDALAHDRQQVRSRLRDLVRRPEIREALFLASADLDAQIDTWLAEPDSEAGQKVERSLVRYLARMAGRATPFGLFAGPATGRIGTETALTVGERRSLRRHTRLDMDYVWALVRALEQDPALRETLTYEPNSSLCQTAARLRYAEVRLDGQARSYHLVAVDPTEYLERTLQRARGGARRQELAELLMDLVSGVSMEEALAFIDELINSQLLVSTLAPAVTGPEPIPALVQELRRHPAAARAAEALGAVALELAAIDDAGLGADPERYRQVAERLRALPAPVPLTRLFQADLVKPGAEGVTLGADLIPEIQRGIAALQFMAQAQESQALEQFRQAFVERYETREVPLMEALDEEAGIGFASYESEPLLEAFPGRAQPAPDTPFGRLHSYLLRKLHAAWSRGEREIAVDPDELGKLRDTPPPPLPGSFAVMVAVESESHEALRRGDCRIIMEGCGGPSGARMLGRFCHGDPALEEGVRTHLEAEAALEPDAIFTEIVHLPEGRIGNILLRPVLRAYEIPFLGRSGAPADRQIPLTDLLVSVRDGRIILRSARLGRQIIPRLTSAHNYGGRGLGLYRFLGALQTQGVLGGLAWDWGPLSTAPFLPRVTCGRAVLSPARWLLTGEELKALKGKSGADQYQAVQALRLGRGLPRFVLVKDSDNELPVDLDNVLSVETFAHLVRNRPGTVLVELLPAPGAMPATGPDGRYVHELVIPFVQKAGQRAPAPGARGAAAPAPTAAPAAAAPPAPTAAPAAAPACPRSFPPGSEWLYLKLYTGTATADSLLTDVIGPVVADARRTGAIDRWFFIRYGDPRWHLRVRFHGAPDRLLGEVLPALHSAAAPHLQGGSIWRMQLDTYQREVERYGGPAGMLLAEQLFEADSDAVLAVLSRYRGEERARARWRLALAGMDRLLGDLGFDLPAKTRLLRSLRDGFAVEFRLDGPAKGRIGEKFRLWQPDLRNLLMPAQGANPGANPGALEARSRAVAPVAAALQRLASAGALTTTPENLAASYLHMHANRILRSAQRTQETVLYDFLHRLYLAAAARGEADR